MIKECSLTTVKFMFLEEMGIFCTRREGLLEMGTLCCVDPSRGCTGCGDFGCGRMRVVGILDPLVAVLVVEIPVGIK